MTRRRLTSDEVDLWRKVADSTHRMHPNQPRHDAPKPKPKPIKVTRPHLSDFELGSKSMMHAPKHDLLPRISEQVARQPVVMDKRAFGRLKRGKLVPEGKIDLHGLTLDQAHPALTGFLLRSHAERKRLVLIITGKGKVKYDDGPIPTRRGVLKHQVPQWLAMAPLGGVVLQVVEAHLKHGGTGAYYVYLRRH